MAVVFVPAPLRRLTGGQTRIEIAAGSVGELREYVNLFVNTTEIREMSGLGTPLAAGDEVSIIPRWPGE